MEAGRTHGATTPRVGAGSRAARRPQSASVCPSANHKLVKASPSPRLNCSPYNSGVPMTNKRFCELQRPQSSRRPRPPSALVSSNSRARPSPLALNGTTTAYGGSIAQRVVQEEVDAQRQVTREAQRQLHELQAALARRKAEVELVQRHLQAFTVLKADLGMATETTVAATTERSLTKPAASTECDAKAPAPDSSDGMSDLKNQIARQDAYKKRLRHLQDRLERHVQFLVANIDVLTQQRDAARNEMTLCHNRSTVETNKHRELLRQKLELQDKRDTFARNIRPVLESYRDELASRSVMTQRRQDADRRREELLRLVGARTAAGVNCSPRALSTATAAVSRSASMRMLQRRDSYEVLIADASDSQRETLFAVYEGQYARVLRETGEADLNVVLERFQTYHESVARLREIEAEQRVEGARLEREQQAHSSLVAHLRVSGTVEVGERRQRVRDRLEVTRHAQQLEKVRAHDGVADQLKAFIYLQQGVLHIVELLQCLDGRGTMHSLPPVVLTAARAVVNVSQPAEVIVNAVSPALQVLTQHAREVVRRGQQREWLRLPALAFSVPQVERLEQFAPEVQAQRSRFLITSGASEDKLETKDGDRQETEAKAGDEELQEEERGAAAMRYALKRQEQDTLRQVDFLLRNAAEAKQQQQQRKKSQAIPASGLQLPLAGRASVIQGEAETAMVLAFFREQRRAERQELRHAGHAKAAGMPASSFQVRHRRSTNVCYVDSSASSGITPGGARYKPHPPPT